MALLTTAPYDPTRATAFVGDLIRLAAQMEEQRAQHAQQAREQAAADQRRAFEFDRRMEFDRARTAEDDRRANEELAWKKQVFTSENAPLVLTPSGGGVSPSTSLPVLAAPGGSGGDVAASPEVSSPLPDSIPVDSTGGTESPWATSMQVADAVEPGPGSSPPADTPELALTAEGAPNIDLTSPSKTLPALPSGGVVGGPHRASMNLMPAPVPDVAKPPPVATAAPAVPMPETTPSQNLATTIQQMQASGIPISRKTLNAALPSILESQLKTKTAADAKPITKVYPDGSLRIWNPQTRDFDTLQEKPTGQTIDSFVQENGFIPVPEHDTYKNKDGIEYKAGLVGGKIRLQPYVPKPEQASLEEVTKGMTFNPDHNTYKNSDGAEFFPAVTNGKVSLRPFKPDAHPAKRTWGSDGNVYYFDAQGNPLKPIPDGVELRETSKLQTATLKDGSVVMIHPDGNTSEMIPGELNMPAKSRQSYIEDVQLAAMAKDELTKEEKALSEKGNKNSWFGVSADSVDKKRAEYTKAEQAVKNWQENFPQLKPKETKPLDRAGAAKFLQQAAGDKAKAKELARAAGFSF